MTLEESGKRTLAENCVLLTNAATGIPAAEQPWNVDPWLLLA
jgi:hypothetical protein